MIRKSKPPPSATLEEAAFRLLSRRDHSRRELEKKLGRAYEPEEIRLLLDRLEAEGWLDDARFARMKAASRMKGGRGRIGALRSLMEAGVDRSSARQAVEDSLKDLDEPGLCRQAALRKMRSLEREPDARKKKEKLWRHLSGRGFPADLVLAVVEETLRTESKPSEPARSSSPDGTDAPSEIGKEKSDEV